MRLFPCLCAAHSIFLAPDPLISSDFLLKRRRHLPKVAEEEFSRGLPQPDSLKLRNRRFKDRLELMPREATLHQRRVLSINSDLTLFPALTEHQMFGLDLFIDRAWVAENLTGLPCRLVHILICLEA